MPSYEEHLVQMEAILKSSIYGEQSTMNRIHSTEILCETVYDVLSLFFSHVDPVITLAAFEVYVRCAYCAYSLLSIEYEEGDGPDDGELPSALTWRFILGHSHSPPAGLNALDPRRQGSVSDRSTRSAVTSHSPPVLAPVIASFSDLAALEKGFKNVAALLPIFEPHEFCQRYGSTEPPNIMNLALRIFYKADDVSEDTWAERALKLVKDHNIPARA
ncbi:acetyl-CoA carboxylase [Boletus reticuloceps]|uniref:Acetyl-CoA carboxylase n=1 Tax=Boletus reticuloceps TaxID=495285 RepID=A0A8I2YK66_9AGAM|nr:acetyl-CoA carboxylase [Boletus reticuloceps]